MTKEWIETTLRINEKIGDFMMWAGGKVILSVPAFVIYTWKQTSRLSLHLAEMAEHSYSKILLVFDSLPYDGMHGSKIIEVEALPVNNLEVSTDVLEAIEGKQVMLLGEMGSGKSTIAQYLAYTIGGQVRVFEPEGTPTDWNGLEVVGKGEDWDSIDAAMAEDLDDLSAQMKVRTEKGDAALNGTERIYIGEEFPEIVAKCDHATKWLERHARRGRKARRCLILLSQYDRASAWGMEGKLDLLDCFRRIRLGKKAIAHAKSLKNQELLKWLQAERGRALIDDEPLQLPNYREMVKVIQQSNFGSTHQVKQLPSGYESVTKITPELPPEATENQAFQPLEASFSDSPEAVLERILVAFDEEKSDDWIAKNIFGATGGNNYYKAKKRVAAIRNYSGLNNLENSKLRDG